MTPVISPWVFYFMTVADNLSCLSVIIMVLSMIVLGVTGFVFLMEMDCCDEDESTTLKRIIKFVSIVLVVSALLSCLIPGEQTITKMIIAQNVTYERVEEVSDTVTTVYNDIMDLFQESDESGDSDG